MVGNWPSIKVLIQRVSAFIAAYQVMSAASADRTNAEMYMAVIEKRFVVKALLSGQPFAISFSKKHLTPFSRNFTRNITAMRFVRHWQIKAWSSMRTRSIRSSAAWKAKAYWLASGEKRKNEISVSIACLRPEKKCWPTCGRSGIRWARPWNEF